MIVGFTGTRRGMTAAQHRAVCQLVQELRPTEVHHGCCVGADAQAHAVAMSYGWPIHGHPGPSGKLRMLLSDVVDQPGFREAKNVSGFCKLYPAKEYGARNQVIVNKCDVLVAAPAEQAPQSSGGTWQTVRRARTAGKHVIIVWPDGTRCDS